MLSHLSADVFLRYLLLPLLALIWAVGLFVLNQRQGLAFTVRSLLLLLLFAVPIALAGFFGLLDLWFMPFCYLGLAVASMALGVLYLYVLNRTLGYDWQEQFWLVHVLTQLILLLGTYCFSLLFDACGSLQLRYGLWAATCMLSFYVPLFFVQTFEALVSIPDQVRQLWYYPANAEEVVSDANPFQLMIAAVELYKSPQSLAPVRVKARLPQDMVFGQWFQKFVDDYNYTFAAEPIETTAPPGYGWLFYAVWVSPFRRRRYIDASRTIAQNRLTERCVIVAKWVAIPEQHQQPVALA